jgi:predicted aspartyl protease
MAVRVRLKLTHNDREAETVALVNTGFETDEPEILLPLKLAEKLGLHLPLRAPRSRSTM